MNTVNIADLTIADGQPFVLPPAPTPVCKPGEFIIAATAFEHSHAQGEVGQLLKAGATLKWFYEPDPQKQAQLAQTYPQAKAARSLDEILDDPQVKLVCAADIPSKRAALGIRCMQAGKDYLTDKTAFTTLDQIADVRQAIADTHQKFMVYYSERLCNESAMLAGELINQGAIGKVIQVIGLGPHRMNAPSTRPDWFFKKKYYGGILCDIGSHQCEQFLSYVGTDDATVVNARVCNANHPEFPELEDFGEANLVADNGASFYYRVDWFTPDGLSSWSDGRTLVLGTDGTIELRKFADIATGRGGNQLYLADRHQEVHVNAENTVGTPFFNQLILDCINRTENAMTQEHALKAGELSVKSQLLADAIR